jgi:hypothetical protein
MRRRALALLVLACAAAEPAAAALVFTPGWEGGVAWDSNVQGASGDDESGFSLRSGPELHLERPEGDFTFDLRYGPRYSYEFNVDGASGFDHFATGRGEWRVTPLTTLSLGQDLAVTRSLLNIPQDPGSPTDLSQGGVEVGNEQALRSATTFVATRRLSPVLELQAVGSGSIYEYENEQQADGRSFSGSLQMMRAISRRLGLGMGTSVTRQTFDRTAVTAEGRGTTFYQGYGILSYDFDRNTVLSVQAGPAWTAPDEIEPGAVQTRTYGTLSFNQQPYLVAASTCPARADGTFALSSQCAPASYFRPGNPTPQPIMFLQSSNPLTSVGVLDSSGVTGSITGFGRVSLTRHWEEVTGILSFQRTASASGGFGTSTNLDVLSAQLTWQPDDRWTVSTTASWDHQTSSSEVAIPELALEPTMVYVDALGNLVDASQAFYVVPDAGLVKGLGSSELTDSAIDTRSYRFDVRVTREISRHLSVFGTGTAWQQVASGELEDDSTSNDLRFELGLSWTWDPIQVD